MIYTLADCPNCSIRYALLLDGYGGWFYFRALTPLGPPMGRTAGGKPYGIIEGQTYPFCIQCAADLTIVDESAVMNSDGRWIHSIPPPCPILN